MGGRDIEVARHRAVLARSVAMVLIASAVSPDAGADAGAGAGAAPLTTPVRVCEHAVIDRIVDRQVATESNRQVATESDRQVAAETDRQVATESNRQVAVVLLEHHDLELTIPVSRLPPTASEGDCLQIGLSMWGQLSVRIDHVLTHRVRARVEERRRALLDEREGRRFPAD